MASQQEWYGHDPAGIAANLVTVSDIAAWTSSDPAAAQSWTGYRGFPQPFVPASAGGPVWWWPAVREFILSHADDLAGYQPPPAPPPRPPGKTGPTPGPRNLTAFDVRQIRAMRSQLDDQGNPRYTGAQIASTLPVEVHLAQIYRIGPAQLNRPTAGLRHQRRLSDLDVTAIRDLRALATPTAGHATPCKTSPGFSASPTGPPPATCGMYGLACRRARGDRYQQSASHPPTSRRRAPSHGRDRGRTPRRNVTSGKPGLDRRRAVPRSVAYEVPSQADGGQLG